MSVPRTYVADVTGKISFINEPCVSIVWFLLTPSWIEKASTKNLLVVVKEVLPVILNVAFAVAETSKNEPAWSLRYPVAIFSIYPPAWFLR